MKPTEELNEAKLERIRSIFQDMLRLCVEAPDDLSVTTESEGNTVRFVSVQRKEDVKRLVGKSGVNSQALRRWLMIVGARHDRRFIFEIKED